MKPKIISVKGKPHLVIISYEEYVALLEAAKKPMRLQVSTPTPKPHPKKVSVANSIDIPEEVRRKITNGKSPVKAWRLYRDLTQSGLAKLAGISNSTLSLIENEARHGTTSTQEAIAIALDVPTRLLFDEKK